MLTVLPPSRPSALRHSLSLYEPLVSSANLGTTLALPQDPRTISPVLSPSVAGEAGSVRSERARDSFGLPPEKAVQEVLSALGGRSLVDAQERIDGPLAKEEEADFPGATRPLRGSSPPALTI